MNRGDAIATLGEQMNAGLVDEATSTSSRPRQRRGIRDRPSPPVVCGEIDSLWVCVTASSYQRWRDLVTFH